MHQTAESILLPGTTVHGWGKGGLAREKPYIYIGIFKATVVISSDRATWHPYISIAMDKETFCGELYASNKEDQDDDYVLSTLRSRRRREVINSTGDPNAISEKELPREAPERETVGVPGLDHSINPNKKPKLARDGRRKKAQEPIKTVNGHPSVLNGLVLCRSNSKITTGM